ncbi:hypothetical protein [Methylosinus sp. Ce-a6]|uniref:hypothetical protein n=1 Tax=Methylosinus sp. Ce-a6 TaxID=2172005 RepID=UPI00135CE36F|nr:hypothetical protein [Methylosinus sp. Ce-a6]
MPEARDSHVSGRSPSRARWRRPGLFAGARPAARRARGAAAPPSAARGDFRRRAGQGVQILPLVEGPQALRPWPWSEHRLESLGTQQRAAELERIELEELARAVLLIHDMQDYFLHYERRNLSGWLSEFTRIQSTWRRLGNYGWRRMRAEAHRSRRE